MIVCLEEHFEDISRAGSMHVLSVERSGVAASHLESDMGKRTYIPSTDRITHSETVHIVGNMIAWGPLDESFAQYRRRKRT